MRGRGRCRSRRRTVMSNLQPAICNMALQCGIRNLPSATGRDSKSLYSVQVLCRGGEVRCQGISKREYMVTPHAHLCTLRPGADSNNSYGYAARSRTCTRLAKDGAYYIKYTAAGLARSFARMHRSGNCWKEQGVCLRSTKAVISHHLSLEQDTCRAFRSIT